MPFTFLAHQAPLLPPLRRRGLRVDGLCLVIGSMAPDFAYALQSTGHLHVEAHRFPALVTFCVPVTLLVAWLVSRVIAPVAPDHLPRSGPFHLADYRGLRAHRFRWVSSPVSAFVGALSHTFLDQFTHSWGLVARHWRWYRHPLLDGRWLGKVWAPFELAQFAGHVFLSAWCVWLLAGYGRDRWFGADAREIEPFACTPRSTAFLVGATMIGTVAGAADVLARRVDESTDIMRVFGAAFVGLVVGFLLASTARKAPIDG